MSIRMPILALALLLPLNAHASTLYADLGGKEGIEKLVERATGIWTTDPRIAATFDDANMVRLKQKLAEQFCSLTDGGCTYTGHGMVEAHRGLHLSTRDFNALVEDLQQAMDQLGIPFATQNRFLALLAPLYREVVSK